MLAIHSAPGLSYPDGEDFFSASQRYPEAPFGHVASRHNPAYEAVRETLRTAGLDAGRFGTPSWNPLQSLVPPGSRVFVLCNFVYHRRPGESEATLQGKCIHGSVLRALVDYVLLAVGSQGRVRFGNAPLQACNWDRVLADTGADRVAAFYRQQGAPVEARDLRLVVAERDVLGRVVSFESRDEVAGAREIDLGGESLLSELGGEPGVRPHFRVADYDPRRTEAFHAGASHRYVIHREILEADVVISLSKLKTHEKVGITCGLKGFVGTVGHKDCLAHHRFGSADGGGDEYPGKLRALEPFSRFQDWLAKRPRDAAFQGALQIADRTARRVLRRLGVVQGGAWHGNDTCWRMALDLARIAHYADVSGVMRDKPQRTHLSLIDGIVAGEGDGPLDPDSVAAGVLVFGDDVAVADLAACRLMGFDPDRIPLVSRAFSEMSYRVTPSGSEDSLACWNGRDISLDSLPALLGRPFRPPAGWRDRLGGRA